MNYYDEYHGEEEAILIAQQQIESDYIQEMEYERDITREAIARLICLLTNLDPNEQVPVSHHPHENNFIGNVRSLYVEMHGTDNAKIFRYVKRWQTLSEQVEIFQTAIEAQHRWMKKSDPLYARDM